MTLNAIVLALGVLATSGPQAGQGAAPHMVHVTNTFRFTVAAPLERVAPLFGPEAERAWAGPHWNPEFLYPEPPKDVQGAVFAVQHGDHTSVWVNTIFDVRAGRMQYVAFIDEVVATVVDVTVTSSGRSRSTVEVTYARTALRPAANERVRALGESDRASGPEWQKGIETCLGIAPK